MPNTRIAGAIVLAICVSVILLALWRVATESRQFVQDVQSRPEPAPGETLYFTSIHSRADSQLSDNDLIDIHKTIRGIGVFVFEYTDL